MDINIIDRDFNFLGQIDEYKSFMPTKKWQGIGGVEFHLNVNTTHAEHLQKENIMFTDERKAYVINYREANSIDGTLVVKGLEIKSYLARWIVFPLAGQAYYRINSNVETIMKEYVSSTLQRKGITNIVVAGNQNRGTTTVYQSRYKYLAEELEKLSIASGLGWDIVLDVENKQFVFDVLEGLDRTSGQDLNPNAIFSVDYDNIGEQTLIESRADYFNTAVVAGQGEGADREITVVGDAEGLDSYELFVDARDLEDSSDLPERGNQKLSEVQETLTFDSQVLTDKNLIYEEDFKLGDIATIQNSEWNITTDRRITEVTEIYEATGFRLDVAFGEPMPTLIDLVKKATDGPISEGGSEGEQGSPGQDGIDGKNGVDGIGLEYQWNDTQLGVKREDDVNYQYKELEGPQGARGVQGDKGDTGPKGDTGEQGLSGTTNWDGITNKPTTFPPSGHGHTVLSIPDTRAIVDEPQALLARHISSDFKANGSVNNPPVVASGSYSHILNIAGWNTEEGSGGFPSQVSFGDGIAIRQAISATTWGPWRKLLDNRDSTGGGTKIVTSPTQPAGLSTGDQWHRVY